MKSSDWIVTVKFPDMPSDADAESMEVFLSALLDSNGSVAYQIIKIERAKR